MQALVLPSLPSLSTDSWRLVLTRWRERAQHRQRVRAAQQELAALGEHQFNDLGVGRSEMAYWLGRGADR